MTHPRSQDAVLGGQTPPPQSGVVLGGLAHAHTIAWWALNDGDSIARDRNGKHPGTIHYATLESSNEGVQRSLRFDGETSHIRVNNGVDLNLGRRDFSICFWLRLPLAIPPVMTVLGKEHPLDFAGGWCVVIYEGKLACILKPEYGGLYERYLLPDRQLNDDQWHHITITVDRNSATGHWYIDGTMVSQPFFLRYPMGLLTNSLPLYLGRAADQPRYWLLGHLADVRLLKRSLSPPQVRLVYESVNVAPDNYTHKLLETGLRL
ncbi:MAG: LamG domain-containing protein [Leptolyngbyaceae cyanobacterium SL_7_1]|nr:LamG domain-containing protein [Leptolyngbyaceae cyanobacterium SL_7_1]